jgi:hypothetical protein
MLISCSSAQQRMACSALVHVERGEALRARRVEQRQRCALCAGALAAAAAKQRGPVVRAAHARHVEVPKLQRRRQLVAKRVRRP